MTTYDQFLRNPPPHVRHYRIADFVTCPDRCANDAKKQLQTVAALNLIGQFFVKKISCFHDRS